ncbi:tetratricopeptide repeat-containing sulfotransferase family protein [Hyphococcus sp.]|jgi:tetratricopeptide (TPR) repeat protein|uniref:tetratricopeptide repeat-containing sulfotransferase family protein n=1 Tax=Hyphococcus sp. TaxID=2038636 RepID=UPI003D12FF02
MLEQALAARLNGDDQTAIRLSREILAANPGDAEAASLLGVSLAETGDLAAARPLVIRALESAPQSWRFLLNYSVLLEREGDLAAARAEAETAAIAAPERFECWGRLGDLAGKLQDYNGAADALEKALAIQPHPALALRLAGAAYETGQYDRALAALDLFEKSAPGHPQALMLRTHIARQKNDWEGLAVAAEAAMKAAPEEEAARVALAYAHSQTGHFKKAVEVYRPLAEKTPQKADHLATLGKYLIWSRKLDEAADYFRKALELEPGHSAAAGGLARYLNFHGDFENAAIYARQAVASDPNNAEAFAELALAAGSNLTDAEVAQLKGIGDNEHQGPKHRAMAYYAAGDALHQRKDRQGAFDAWAAANRLKHAIGDIDKNARYNPAEHEAYIDKIIASFPTDAPPAPRGPRGPVPIFIVGMPRSGTTLLDSAISAHALVASGGELPYMSFALTEFFTWARQSGWRGGAIPDDLLSAFREGYWKDARGYGVAEATFITDKQPTNFLSVGLIRRVFPKARIIHIRRNPVEVGFSIYRRNFTSGWQFSNSLEEIGHYYAQYARLTEHWRETVGEAFTFVQYEDLVRNFDKEIRRLVEFCGLDWDQACLEYYKQDRTVITFSAAQVRKPPSPEHLNSTSPYDAYLEPLRAALTQHGVDLETGALNERKGKEQS